MTSTPSSSTTLTDHESQQLHRANASGRQPVVFAHGLWLLPSSWDRWAALFEDAGYTALTPGWPDDPESGRRGQCQSGRVRRQDRRPGRRPLRAGGARLIMKPAIVGHSFGGLLAQILAGRGLSSATVAISPAPFRGVLPLPISALKSAWPVLGNPANRIAPCR
jgi:pimeloyl-ACP methyl ester carboxylesterase